MVRSGDNIMENTIQSYTDPFPFWVIDNFLDDKLAKQLSNDFMPFYSPNWFSYNNPLEVKKTCNNWYYFPPTTYHFMQYLNSEEFIESLQKLTGIEKLYPDMGLHGAGWHIHGNGGKLNVHFDYNLHPKVNLQRKINIIIYLSQDWDPAWGGNITFWSHNPETNRPLEQKQKLDFKFNRAAIFDTSQNSWHGFNDPIQCPEGQYRKTIAMYYLVEPPEGTPDRKRALFAPSEAQENDAEILKLIDERVKEI